MLPKTAKDTKDSQSRLDFFLMLRATWAVFRGSAVGWIPAFFRSSRFLPMLKGAGLELDPDTDCMGNDVTLAYEMPVGLNVATWMGATLLTGVHDGPPTMV